MLRITQSTLALVFGIGITVAFFLNKVPAELFSGLAGVAITYFFEERRWAAIMKK